MFRKQFKLLHVREDFIEIFTVGDEEEEIVIIDDEEDEVVIMKEEEEDDIIILEEDEEKKDEEPEIIFIGCFRDKAAIYKELLQTIETLMDQIKDENHLVYREQNISSH